MITTSTSPFLYIDWGEDEPGMTLQRQDGNDWVNYKVDGVMVVIMLPQALVRPLFALQLQSHQFESFRSVLTRYCI
jgi:hypothetical protein